MDAAAVVVAQRRPLGLDLLASPALDLVGDVLVAVSTARRVPLLGPGAAGGAFGFATQVERDRLVAVVLGPSAGTRCGRMPNLSQISSSIRSCGSASSLLGGQG